MKEVVFIDGENLRHKIAEVLVNRGRIKQGQALKGFNVRGLIEELVPESSKPEIRYYGAKVRLQGKQQRTRDKALAIIQQKRAWNSNLHKQRIIYLETGALQLRSDGYPNSTEYFIEKGVDVGLAVDMMLTALKYKVGRIILVSSDADLLPAVRALKQESISITYIAYEGFILPSLAQFSSATRTFTDQQILQHFDSDNPRKAKSK